MTELAPLAADDCFVCMAYGFIRWEGRPHRCPGCGSKPTEERITRYQEDVVQYMRLAGLSKADARDWLTDTFGPEWLAGPVPCFDSTEMQIPKPA